MGTLIVFNHVTLDGVMQAPGRPDEDRRGDFVHGGWALPRGDSVLDSVAGESMASVGALVLGRRTYEDFYSFWSNQPESNPFTAVLNDVQKYVASTTLQEPLPWRNSTLLAGDAAEAVVGLKEQSDKDLLIMGSGALIQSLMRRNLIDRYILMIHPLVLGSGRHLFPDGGAYATLRLIDTKTTTTGVVIATYHADERAR